MVCLERGLVTGRFLRDRDRAQAYPPSAQEAGLAWKSRRRQEIVAQREAKPGAIVTGLQERRIAPVEN
jgi:hypothetical protein